MNAQTWPPQTIDPVPVRLVRKARNWRSMGPGMVLFLLAPAVAELCSGATPLIPYLFFGWMLCLLYGCGAILIREYTLRWGKGWPTVFALGLAYGIAEEGIAVRTFFDPTAPALKDLTTYGWALGTNWVWDVHLSLYHAIISIAIPIYLVSLIYPERRAEPWVSSRWLNRCAAGYVGFHVAWLVLYQRPVDGIYILASLAVIAAIVWLARRLPATLGVAPGSGPVPTPRRVAIAGFLATVGVFVMAWGKGLGMPPAGAILAMLLIFGVTARWLAMSSKRPGWTERHSYAVAAGILFFLPAISWLIELAAFRFQIVVGLVTGYLLVRTWRRLRAAEAGQPVPGRATETAAGRKPRLPSAAVG
jgi:hypothetical protein